MLELKNIHYSVDAPEGRTEILRDISLTIPDNKLVVFTGPNGGGKTTLAKAIMGLVTPTSGQHPLERRGYHRPFHHRARAHAASATASSSRPASRACACGTF